MHAALAYLRAALQPGRRTDHLGVPRPHGSLFAPACRRSRRFLPLPVPADGRRGEGEQRCPCQGPRALRNPAVDVGTPPVTARGRTCGRGRLSSAGLSGSWAACRTRRAAPYVDRGRRAAGGRGGRHLLWVPSHILVLAFVALLVPGMLGLARSGAPSGAARTAALGGVRRRDRVRAVEQASRTCSPRPTTATPC